MEKETGNPSLSDSTDYRCIAAGAGMSGAADMIRAQALSALHGRDFCKRKDGKTCMLTVQVSRLRIMVSLRS